MEATLTERPVLLVGSIEWRSLIKHKCPATKFVEHENLPLSLDSHGSLVVAESARLLANAATPDHATPPLYLTFDDTDPTLAFPHRIITTQLDSISDEELRACLELNNPPNLNPAVHFDDALASKVDDVVKRSEFLDVSKDLVCFVLQEWIEALGEGRREVGYLDCEAFRTHLQHLKGLIASYPTNILDIPLTAPTADTASVVKCFHVCERTWFLWTHRNEGLFERTGDSTYVPRFRSCLQPSQLAGGDLVRASEALLLHLFMAVLIVAPPTSRLVDVNTSGDEHLSMEFTFPLSKPPYSPVRQLGNDEFVRLFVHNASEELKKVNGDLELTPANHVRISLARVR